MAKKKVAPTDEQRAPDPDGALEVAFVEGTLPEEDRRDPEKLESRADLRLPGSPDAGVSAGEKEGLAPVPPIQQDRPDHWESLSGRSNR